MNGRFAKPTNDKFREYSKQFTEAAERATRLQPTSRKQKTLVQTLADNR